VRANLLLIIATLALVGCGLREEQLPDGTRCAVYTFVYGVSIDCDWSECNDQ